MSKPILLLFTGIILLNNLWAQTGSAGIPGVEHGQSAGHLQMTDSGANGTDGNDTVPGFPRSHSADTSSPGVLLPEITIQAFGQNRPPAEVAAAVSVIGSGELNRWGGTSVLPAINTAPGVRMEERSPGSYRLNIRGSSLRSPFGVRNVKIYLNGIPFTDPGGNTYFNQLSFFDIAGLEIIKGPGSSLYGAGTGGVLLVNTGNDSTGKGITLNYNTGSWQSHTANLSAALGSGNFAGRLSYTHQQSQGYREHSAMRRSTASWQTTIRNGEKQSLSAYILYGDLYYETPGGLTATQFRENPRAARPAAGSFPGAADNKAAISQKTFWAGVQQHYRINGQLNNTTAIYGAFSQIRNPAIFNYERRSEPHFGGRTAFNWVTRLSETTLKLTAGAEFQQGFSSVKVYKNNQGGSGALQTDDEVTNRISSVFVQAVANFPHGWVATGGISINNNSVAFHRLSEIPAFNYNTDFYNESAPRLSLLKKLNNRLSLYAMVSKGFSPPTVAELLPSTSVINTSLEAERGINYEAGFRSNFFRNRLSLDINAYRFGLKKAITQRRDAGGAEYFVNAGNTRQKGVESSLRYRFLPDQKGFIADCALWLNHTFTHFRYKEFRQEAADFSGHRIPGVAPNTLAGGIDLTTRPGIYLNLTWFYYSAMALNDANSAYSESFQLPGFRTGYRKRWAGGLETDWFISGDNLLDESYSLGYDINAAGGRFYNAAPGTNFTAGVRLSLL